MTNTKPIISIENVVASASVDQAIDLADVTKKFPDTEWHPDQFPGLVFRLTSPKTATLIFRSGKMVCTGGKSEAMSIKAVRTVVQRLRKGKIKIKKDAVITVQNIVASGSLGGKIHLEDAARGYHVVCMNLNSFQGLYIEWSIQKLYYYCLLLVNWFVLEQKRKVMSINLYITYMHS